MANTAARLERMRRTADDLAAAIIGKPESLLDRRPAEGAWCAKEVVCHLRDVEEFYFDRIRFILAHQKPTLVVLDPDRWAEERQYLRHDVAQALAAFRRRREETLSFLRALGSEEWERAGLHPLRGRLTVRHIVHGMARHDDLHLDQLARALDGRP